MGLAEEIYEELWEEQCLFIKKLNSIQYGLGWKRLGIDIKLITGESCPEYYPEVGDMYYCPNKDNTDKFVCERWKDSEVDRWMLKRGWVLETKEEAIVITDTMLEAIDEYMQYLKKVYR